MSGRIAKSQIPIRHQATLPIDAQTALILAKNHLKAGGSMKRFYNEPDSKHLEGPPLPGLPNGYAYYEWDIGVTRLGGRGSRRFVFVINEVHEGSETKRQIRERYYTEEHYGKFSFERVV